jgi:hypothetical protein
VIAALAAGLSGPAAAGAQPRSGAVERDYREGKQAYAEGDFETAAARFADAYLLSDDPTYLFNLAQAQRLDGDCRGAYRSYREYLDKVPDAPNRADVEEKIAALETCARPAPRLMPVPDSSPLPERRQVSVTPVAEVAPPPPRRHTGLWVAAIGTVVAAASAAHIAYGDDDDPSRLLSAAVIMPIGAGLLLGGVGNEILAGQRARPDL